MENRTCPVCNNPVNLLYKLRHNVYKCDACKLHTSDADFDHSFESELDPEVREVGLKNLREQNFEVIIDRLKNNLAGAGKKGLEIGAGSGWWLEACKRHGIDCVGIEPELSFEEMYKKSGVKVFFGFYPNEQVSAKEAYDFIIFNDVFEHIPQLEPLIQSLRHDLKKEGLLIINIPMSSGFFYKTACFLHSIGISSYLERMWQFHFHSPHMNYFNQQNLSQLLARHNFTNIDTFKLDSLDFKHLKERVASDKKVGKIKGFFLTTMLSSLKPFINSLNPDIKVLVFKKNA